MRLLLADGQGGLVGVAVVAALAAASIHSPEVLPYQGPQKRKRSWRGPEPVQGSRRIGDEAGYVDGAEALAERDDGALMDLTLRQASIGCWKGVDLVHRELPDGRRIGPCHESISHASLVSLQKSLGHESGTSELTRCSPNICNRVSSSLASNLPWCIRRCCSLVGLESRVSRMFCLS